MHTIPDIKTLRQHLTTAKRSGEKLGFVPTMGFLHEGHLSLVRLAKQHCDQVVVSIFVNPTQFNNPEDLEKYPRDEVRDLKLLASEGVDYRFIPQVSEIYSDTPQYTVKVGKLASGLEGPFRPGHFDGVATVVSILFNIVNPDIAVFGEKDFQQLRIIEELVKDLKFDLTILRGPTLREEGGLAMSSRNVRPSTDARRDALILSQTLFEAQAMVDRGEFKTSTILEMALKKLTNNKALALEYLEIVDEDTLTPIPTITSASRMVVAAWVDGVRLIDNVPLTP